MIFEWVHSIVYIHRYMYASVVYSIKLCTNLPLGVVLGTHLFIYNFAYKTLHMYRG